MGKRIGRQPPLKISQLPNVVADGGEHSVGGHVVVIDVDSSMTSKSHDSIDEVLPISPARFARRLAQQIHWSVWLISVQFCDVLGCMSIGVLVPCCSRDLSATLVMS